MVFRDSSVLMCRPGLRYYDYSTHFDQKMSRRYTPSLLPLELRKKSRMLLRWRSYMTSYSLPAHSFTKPLSKGTESLAFVNHFIDTPEVTLFTLSSHSIQADFKADDIKIIISLENNSITTIQSDEAPQTFVLGTESFLLSQSETLRSDLIAKLKQIKLAVTHIRDQYHDGLE